MLMGSRLFGQDYPSIPIDPPPADTIAYSDENTESAEVENYSNFHEGYNFSDSDQWVYQQKSLDPNFDKVYWEKERQKLKFDEEIEKEKEKKKNNRDTSEFFNKMNTGSGPDLSSMKFIFIIGALIVLGIIIYLLVRNTNFNNKNVKSNILINFDDLDESTLRHVELATPLSEALRKGDYQTAYRIKYLEVLQHLIQKNLIFYKKEKTNYEYLLQLSGKNVYEPFRLLTFNFDGIWYGEMKIDRERYESLLPYFNNFESSISNLS